MDAPATNPEADPSDDLPAGVPVARRTGRQAVPEDAGKTAGRDGRDAWIREQRPPHWD